MNKASSEKNLPRMLLEAAKTIENITSSPNDLSKVSDFLRYSSSHGLSDAAAEVLPGILLDVRRFLSLETSSDYWVEKLSEDESFWSASNLELAESLCRRKQVDITIIDSVIDQILTENSVEVISVRI
jgi:hypothetical protein